MGGVGSGGHNRRASEEHHRAGTFRADRHSRRTLADVVAEGGLGSVGPAPRWMAPEAKNLWRNLRPQLESQGILCSLDRPAFEVLCTTWANLRKVQAMVAEQGCFYTTKRGVIREHPGVKLERRLAASFLSWAGDFGLTPMSRKRLGVSGAVKEPSGEDAIDQYFFGRN